MKYTLLELVQAVLSSTDGEEVNSISDTVESQQVVEIVKTVYNDIISRGDIGRQKILFTLTPSGDNDKPVLMTKPSSVANIDYIKYNCIALGDTDPIWRDIQYIPPNDFVDYCHQFTPSDADVGSMVHPMDSFNLTFYFKTDVAPQYYTVFEDNTLIFDAYDSAVDTTLQGSKTLAYGTKNPVFVKQDSWTPELEPEQFALLLNEAKSLAWLEQKQSQHPKAEQTARRNWIHLARRRRTTPTGHRPRGETALDSFVSFARRK